VIIHGQTATDAVIATAEAAIQCTKDLVDENCRDLLETLTRNKTLKLRGCYLPMEEQCKNAIQTHLSTLYSLGPREPTPWHCEAPTSNFAVIALVIICVMLFAVSFFTVHCKQVRREVVFYLRKCLYNWWLVIFWCCFYGFLWFLCETAGDSCLFDAALARDCARGNESSKMTQPCRDCDAVLAWPCFPIPSFRIIRWLIANKADVAVWIIGVQTATGLHVWDFTLRIWAYVAAIAAGNHASSGLLALLTPRQPPPENEPRQSPPSHQELLTSSSGEEGQTDGETKPSHGPAPPSRPAATAPTAERQARLRHREMQAEEERAASLRAPGSTL